MRQDRSQNVIALLDDWQLSGVLRVAVNLGVEPT